MLQHTPYYHNGRGWMEIWVGPMTSQKTTNFILRIKWLLRDGKRILVVRVDPEGLYPEPTVSTRDGLAHEATVVSGLEELKALLAKQANQFDVLAISEVQFLPPETLNILQALADSGIIILLEGLEQNFRGEQFGELMPLLLVDVERLEKLPAVCVICGQPAHRTQRMDGGKPAARNAPTVMVEKSVYEPRCRACHQVGPAIPTAKEDL